MKLRILILLIATLLVGYSGARTTASTVVLHDFNPGVVPEQPDSNLVQGPDGSLYGTSFNGGSTGVGMWSMGTVYKVSSAGVFTVLHSFTGTDGIHPALQVAIASDGTLYGATTSSGPYGYDGGTIYKITQDGTFSSLHTLVTSDGSNPGPVIVGANGNVFGTAASGGAAGDGSIFEVSSSGTFSVVHSFAGPDGNKPSPTLLQDSAGDIFGFTTRGGANGYGTIFKIDAAGVFSTVHNFSSADSESPTVMIIDSRGNLYGGTLQGGVFKVTPDGTFSLVATVGTGWSFSQLVLGSDGNLYGQNFVSLYQVKPDGTVTVLHNFPNLNTPVVNGLVEITSGTFIGSTIGGGASGAGSLFSITSTGTFTNLVSFGGTNGLDPQGIIVGNDHNVYGVNETGLDNVGQIFRLTPAGTFDVVSKFTYADGVDPGSVIVGADGNYYGACSQGGIANAGAVYQLTPSMGWSLIHSFAKNEANENSGTDIMQASDGMLYGAAFAGGPTGYGDIFKMTTAGVFTDLHDFAPYDGHTGGGPLTEGIDGNMYGTAHNSYGSNPTGMVYSISPSGTFDTVYTFSGPYNNPIYPVGGLVSDGLGNFYGSGAQSSQSQGQIYKIAPNGNIGLEAWLGAGGPAYTLTLAADGNLYGVDYIQDSQTGFETPEAFQCQPALGTLSYIHTFSAAEGDPSGGLTQDTNGILYGTSPYGGAYGDGSIFAMTTSGAVTTVYSFSGSTGANPWSGLTLIAPGEFVGTTRGGGKYGSGTVFQFTATPPAPTNVAATPSNHTVELTWDNDVIASSYNIYRGTTSGGETLLASGITNTTYLDSGLVNGTTYYYYVTAVNNFGVSGDSNEVSSIPPAPASLTATGGNASVSLTWNASASATSYNVYEGTTAGGENSTPIGSVTGTTYTATGLTNGTTYYFEVEAVNGGGSSPASNEAHATPTSGLATFVNVDTSNQGNWKGVYGGDGYNVVGDGSGNNPSIPSYATVSVSGNGTAVWAANTLSGQALAQASTGSIYRVAACWYSSTNETIDLNLTDGNSHQIALYLLDWDNKGRTETVSVADAATNTVLDTQSASGFAGGAYYVWNISGHVTIKVTCTGGPNAVLSGLFFGGAGNGASTAPSTPTSLSASVAGGVSLTWNASTGATSYDVYRGTTAGGESPAPIATGVTGTAYVDSGVSVGTTYYYRVLAVNAVGGSGWSNEASAAVPSSVGSFETVDTLTQGNWKGVYGADGFNVVGDGSGNNPSYPSYASVGVSGNGTAVWAPYTIQAQALLQASTGSVNRIAGCWYSGTNFTIDLNLTDGHIHQVALYVLDWDQKSRKETLTVTDAATNAVLDTRSPSSFAGGYYYVWNLGGHVKITVTCTGGPNAVVSGLFFGRGAGFPVPLAPTNLTATPSVTNVSLSWKSSLGATSYNVYRGTSTNGESVTPIATGVTGTSYQDTAVTTGSTYFYEVTAVNATGASAPSNEVVATVPQSTVSFVTTDTSTQGSWKGVYGADGFDIIGDPSGNNPTYPGYASVSFTSDGTAVWAPSTTSAPALQKAGTFSTDRIAACRYASTSESIDVNLTDGQTHQVALYLLDWDLKNRSETITVADASGNVVRDTRSASSFAGGEYLVWNIAGHVKITITRTGGPNAVVSGLFFR